MNRLTHFSLSFALATMALLPSTFAAGYTVHSVQESLKKQGFYFGETTGKLDEPTRAAIKRFQIRQGMAVTGAADEATLEALQGASPTSETAQRSRPPGGEVSVRERAQNLVQSDREFLNKVEAIDEGQPLSPAPSTSTSASRSASTSPPASEPSRRKSSPLPPIAEGPRGDRQPGVDDRRRSGSVDAEPQRRASSERSTVRQESDAPPAPARISEAEARDFVESYLAAAEGPSPEREVSFYADKVDYFDSGRVNRSFVQKDQRNYYRRWPQRAFDLVAPPKVERASGDAASVRFRVRYAVRGPKEKASGQVENYVRLRKGDSGLKIVAIRERKLR